MAPFIRSSKSFNGRGGQGLALRRVKFYRAHWCWWFQSHPCKYSPDGKLLWVRILSYTSDPYGMDIGADGKPVVMVQAWGPAPDLITPNAFLSSYPSGGGIVEYGGVGLMPTVTSNTAPTLG